MPGGQTDSLTLHGDKGQGQVIFGKDNTMEKCSDADCCIDVGGIYRNTRG